MKAMCDAIHAMGMKVGIYSTPWMGTYAGFIGGSAPNAKSDYGEMAIPEKERKQEDQIFGSYPGVHRRKADHVGAVRVPRAVQDAGQRAAATPAPEPKTARGWSGIVIEDEFPL